MAKKAALSWTSEEYKAIGDYAKRRVYKLSMCQKPNVRYLDDSGKEIVLDINSVMTDYRIQKEEERKEKLRQKQADERAAKQRSYGNWRVG